MSTRETLVIEKSEEPEWYSGPNTLSQFLSKMSHEIRTPLSAVLGFTDLLRGPIQNAEERNSYLDVLERNGQQLHEIIEHVLDLAKIETGGFKLEVSPLAITSLIGDVVGSFDFKAAQKGIEFVIYPAPKSFPKTIVSDPARVQQIFHYLVEGAVQTAKGGKIQISALSHEDTITVSIEHSGMALTATSLKSVFAKIIACALGGNVRMFQKNCDTVYFVTLPLRAE